MFLLNKITLETKYINRCLKPNRKYKNIYFKQIYNTLPANSAYPNTLI